MSEHLDKDDYIGYALQIKVNAFSASAYWKFDEEFGEVRETLTEAVSDREEALDYGYHDEHVRVVGLSVVIPPSERT